MFVKILSSDYLAKVRKNLYTNVKTKVVSTTTTTSLVIKKRIKEKTLANTRHITVLP